MRPQLFPDIHDWPVYKLAKNRNEFVMTVIRDMETQFDRLGTAEIDQILSKTIFQERQRIKSNPWKADPPGEAAFFKKLQREYNENKDAQDSYLKNKQSVSRLIHRYTEEISGSFNINTFLFARKILTWFFHFVYCPFSLRVFSGNKAKIARLEERMIVNGQIESIRSLFSQHTVILVPTHSSNLDSVLVGYMVDTFGGLPAFSYGAGLNLYDSEFFAFFMNRLGAYRVDRRKKNQIYLHTLSTYARLLAEKGVNTIFFPGGTRSRSGEVETKLKLGLLNSMVLAQRNLIQQNEKRKVIIVPVIIGYESVLEARSMILQYLKTTGQEKFITKERPSPITEYLHFIWGMMKKSSRVYLTFGTPLDVFGNRVDPDGTSLDQHGKPVQLADYFRREGEFVQDVQRESVYTKELAESISREYKKNNYILPAHFVAFCAFSKYKEINSLQEDINLVQSPEEEFMISMEDFTHHCRKVLGKLKVLQQEGRALLSGLMNQDLKEIIRQGVEKVGVFHNRRVLIIQDGHLLTQDLVALFYYYNKLKIFTDDLADISDEQIQIAYGK